MKRRRLFRAALGAWTVLVYAFMLAPVVVIVLLAFNGAPGGSFPIRDLTFDWFGKVLTDATLLASLRTSFLLAACASLIATVVGVAAAYALARYRLRGQAVSELVLTMPLLIPHLVMGVALLLSFRLFGLSKNFGLLVMGHVVIVLPFVILTTRHQLQSVPAALEEAAWTLGANRLQAIREVVLPLALPAILTGMLFAFMASFDEVTATLFWRPPGMETVQTQIMAMLQFEVDQRIDALGALLVVFSIVVPFLALIVARVLSAKQADRA
jgi:spermidine/putrescine transport system permease protein